MLYIIYVYIVLYSSVKYSHTMSVLIIHKTTFICLGVNVSLNISYYVIL